MDFSVKGLHIHFVGIKGTGMTALVEIMHSRGDIITGSDVPERFYTDTILERLGLKVLPFSESNITDEVECVIYSSAYNINTNADLAAAKKRGVPCILYTEALGALSKASYSCGVCGVHGKTTTAGLIGTLLSALSLPAQVLAGSAISSFGGSCTMTSGECASGAPKYFVAETCEYQRHFMSFCPQKIVLTSVESDHQDCYPAYEDIRSAFVGYIKKLPPKGELIFCSDDAGACDAAKIAQRERPDITFTPYGEKADGIFKLSFGKIKDGMQFFTLAGLGEFAIRVPGVHTVRNAAAAISLSCALLREEKRAVSESTIEHLKAGLLRFSGGKRRSEVIGRAKTASGDSIIVIDDYGHHPTAIKTTLSGYREFYSGRKIIVDFMSHTYSRTASLFSAFAAAFDSADEIIFHKIYSSAREKAADFAVTGFSLYEAAKKRYGDKAHYFDSFEEAAAFVLQELSLPAGAEYPEGYLVVTMGAGDNWHVGRYVLDALEEKR